ncbi:MAG: methyl-accepting chemotaxis protein [Deinococcus sp.]|uniref:methyl-accepting chemotaxis protein n=1 Tax=Deinococcus sp. TaxID=47478 RepID=UPI0026DC15A8|nr:methyl-accepting chemotaxis protein [Deinococcus sp.]MDO4245333.1 methyl-accepting chemotaxis protein [Deinococcus sp.]
MLQNVPSTDLMPTERPASPGAATRPPRLIDRLSVAQKLGLVGVLFTLPVLVNVVTSNRALGQLAAPVAANGQIVPFVNAASDLRRSVDSLALATRSPATASEVAPAVQGTRQALGQLDALLGAQESPSLFSPLPRVRAELRQSLNLGEVKNQVERYLSAAGTSGDRAGDYAAISAALGRVTDELARASALEVGAGKSDLYHLQRAALNDGLLGLRTNLIRAQLLADRVVSSGAASDRNRLLEVVGQIGPQLQLVGRSLTAAERGQGLDFQADLQRLGTAVGATLNGYRALAAGQPATPQLGSSLQQVDRLLGRSSASIVQASQRLHSRYTRLGVLGWLLTLVSMALAVWLMTWLARRLVGQLRLLNSSTQAVTAGQFDLHLPVRSSDELGTLTKSFNSAATQLRVNAERAQQDRVEAQQLQHNIGEFLDVTMDIAEGDFTRRGQVTADVLGNVVDSINLMTEQLADILKHIQAASSSVTSGSRELLGTTDQIQQGATLTAQQAQAVAQQIEQLTDTIRQMAQGAQDSADIARQALLASQQGQQAVQETLGGMQNIRREVQQVSKRIKSLGDRSLEIQEVVDTISQIAEQTHLLAVNASIEAAGAGAAGGRFAIVADSVRKLANTSAEATTRIAGLIKAVQQEVQSVIADTEEGTREVEQGYRIASTAGERLQEIGQLTEQSARFAETVAASTRQQASGVEQVGAAVQQIAGVAEQAQTAAQQGRSAAQQLEALAQQLDQSVGRFKLPG